jgi:hypothetical protein
MMMMMTRNGDCFQQMVDYRQRTIGSASSRHQQQPLYVARYGPPSIPPVHNQDDANSTSATAAASFDEKEQQLEQIRANTILERHLTDRFRQLVDQVLSAERPEHLPRILVNHMELILSMRSSSSSSEQGTRIIANVLEQVQQEQQSGSSDDNGDVRYSQTLHAIDIILTFAQDFVEQAQTMDQHNKQLLGKIFKAMMVNDGNNNNNNNHVVADEEETTTNLLPGEEVLDRLLEQEKEHFTPGFLRHIEGECERISNAPQVTPQSARLLEILRIVQTRVLEELGQDMGEATVVLGQLMGYNSDEELLGVLEAGLTVRGSAFALEMASLTEEALDGFQRVPGGVDPELVERVTFIDKRLRVYLDDNNQFQ